MKVEFELTLDENNKPCIKFKHHYNIDSLDQKILQIFLNKVREKGCEVEFTGGLSGTDKHECFEKYIIQAKK